MTSTTIKAMEGRKSLQKVLDRECERAKDDLETTLRASRASIDRALALLADGMGVPTTVSGEGMILGHDGSQIDTLAGRWMEAERRRVVLLDIYDEANGLTVESMNEAVAAQAEAEATSSQEDIDRWNEERVGDGPDFAMYSVEGNAKVAEIVENAARVGNLDQAWKIAQDALFALSESVEEMAEAGDTAVRDAVYEDLRARLVEA